MKNELKKPNSKNLYATITYESESNLIHMDWTGYLSLDLVKSGSEELLAIIAATRCPNVLVNNRKVSGPWQTANEWYQNDWNPRAAKAGLTNMAVIMSSDMFTQMSLQGFTKVTKGHYTVRIFNADATARQWLGEQLAATA